MMSNNKLMNYKGFYGTIEFDLESGVLFGKIECINDLVTYEAESIRDLKVAFEDAVNDYIETCEAIGKSPDKPMSGSFNIRIGQKLHKDVYIAATNIGTSINDYIKMSLETSVNKMNNKHIHMHFHTDQNTSYTGKTLDVQPLSGIGQAFARGSTGGSTKATWSSH